tara:strand:- start:1146 stop:1286 length:141 start_codon:yes stop_codon:yes gene_type:complete
MSIGEKIKAAFKKYRKKKYATVAKAGKENKKRDYIQKMLKKKQEGK